jgi:pentatricopeptide repeat protein
MKPPRGGCKASCHGSRECVTGLLFINSRLARYVKAGQHEKTIELFQEMQQKGMTLDQFTFVLVLNA